MPLDELVFRLGDTGTELNTDAVLPFVDILRVYGLDSAPVRETERDHEGVDGGFLDAEFEKGRPLMMDGEVFAEADTLEDFLDVLKAEWAPRADLVPFYFHAPGQSDRVMFVRPRGLRYDWEQNRRRGVCRTQFVFYAEDPRIYDAVLQSVVIPYGGIAGNGFAFTTWLDTWTRTVTDGIGTADSGHTYTLTGTAADFDVLSGVLRVTLAAATGSVYLATPNVTSQINQHLYSQEVVLSATPTGGSISSYIDLRVVDANNYYRVEVTRTTSDTMTVSLIRVVGGATTTMVSGTVVAGATATSTVNVRAEVQQGQNDDDTSLLRVKVWLSGTAEPVAWTAETTTNHITAAGGTRLGWVRSAGNTNVNPTMSQSAVQWWQGVGFNLDFGGGAVPTSGIAVNGGNRSTPAVMTIQGPIENPLIANDTVGLTLNFAINLEASDQLAVDLGAKTVILNGAANRRMTLALPNWFLLAPGINFIRFGGTSAGSPTLTIQFRSAWR